MMGRLSSDDRQSLARVVPMSAAALGAVGAGLLLASQHPLSPAAAIVAFVAWVLVAARFRGLWLYALPAVLPLANLSPWTGWLGFEEFDLFVLGTIAGELASRVGPGRPRPASARDRTVMSGDAVFAASLAAFGGITVLALIRGIVDAGGWSFGWFDGYAQPLNSVKAAKSTLYALALWPLLRDEFETAPSTATKRLGHGMQTGLAIACLAVLSERIAYPGLLDFSSRYRATALFWEMHVGGGAIDAYLALATPFAAWSLWTARSRVDWTLAALIALLACYACLTTFSRGVYAGVAIPLLALGAVWWSRQSRRSVDEADRMRVLAAALAVLLLPIVAFAALGGAGAVLVFAAAGLLFIAALRFRSLHWRSAAALALGLALVAEAVVVIGAGSFVRARLNAGESDFGARLAHWRHALELPAGPTDWLLGIGLGRTPSRYARSIAGGEFSGAVTLASFDGKRVVRLAGPLARADLGGLYTLTQRVALRTGRAHRLRAKTRADAPAEIAVDLCEQHLLYARRCQGKFIQVRAGRDWQDITVLLDGPALSAGPWYAPRLGVLSLAVTGAGAVVELAEVELTAPDGAELIANRDFSAGLAHWLPMAQFHFTPWHVDNLFLELLIERGAVGLGLFIALVAGALTLLLGSPGSAAQIAPFLAASLFGALLVGSLSSILDVPRVAFLLLLLVLASLRMRSGGPGRLVVDERAQR